MKMTLLSVNIEISMLNIDSLSLLCLAAWVHILHWRSSRGHWNVWNLPWYFLTHYFTKTRLKLSSSSHKVHCYSSCPEMKQKYGLHGQIPHTTQGRSWTIYTNVKTSSVLMDKIIIKWWTMSWHFIGTKNNLLGLRKCLRYCVYVNVRLCYQSGKHCVPPHSPLPCRTWWWNFSFKEFLPQSPASSPSPPSLPSPSPSSPSSSPSLLLLPC